MKVPLSTSDLPPVDPKRPAKKTESATPKKPEPPPLPEDPESRALLAINEIRRVLTKPRRPWSFDEKRGKKKWVLIFEPPSMLMGESGKMVSILNKYGFKPVRPKKNAPCICGSKKKWKDCCRP